MVFLVIFTVYTLTHPNLSFSIKSKFNNIFKHIIVFTNDKDTKNNKTLKNIEEAIKRLKKDKDANLNDIDVSQVIIKYVNQNRTSKEEEVRTYFKRLLVWLCDNEEKARSILPNLCENKHYLYDDEEIARNIKQAETFNQLMEKYNISSTEK